MDLFSDLSIGVAVEPTVLLDIVLTAVLIYGVLSLIQGTRAVRLVVGAIILYLVFVMAQELELQLLSGIMQAGAVVGLVALVVVFQPELRRGLDRLGRVGSWGWLSPSEAAGYQRIAGQIAAAAARLSRRRAGALIVIERDTGLGDMAETGVPLDADLSTELLTTLFAPGYPLHDGAVIVSGDRIVAGAVMLPLAERDAPLEDYGTRHRAALGITDQTDALVVVVSEESGAISLAQAGSIVRDLDENELRQRLYRLLAPARVSRRARASAEPGQAGGRSPDETASGSAEMAAAEAAPSSPAAAARPPAPGGPSSSAAGSPDSSARAAGPTGAAPGGGSASVDTGRATEPSR